LKTYFLSIFSLVLLLVANLNMLFSLYIPRVKRAHMGHSDYMKKVFVHQEIAMLKSVEFFEHEIPNAAFGFAIIKVLFWIPGIVSKHFQARLKDASKETRIVFSDPSYWIVLPYTEKQKEQQQPIKIPPPPIRETNHIRENNNNRENNTNTNNNNCICGCGGGEMDCSSQILYNQFTDKVWTKPDWDECDKKSSGNCRNSWTAMNSIEDNFRFCDTPFGFDFGCHAN
jgi:hypothetical protein